MNEILLYTSKGLKLVALPADVQNYAAYRVGPLVAGQSPLLAEQFVLLLSDPFGKALLVAAGATD